MSNDAYGIPQPQLNYYGDPHYCPYRTECNALTKERDALNTLYQTQLKTNEAQAVKLAELQERCVRVEQCNSDLAKGGSE